MGATTHRGPMPPGAPGTIGLMSGLGVVVDALRTHAVDGVSTNRMGLVDGTGKMG